MQPDSTHIVARCWNCYAEAGTNDNCAICGRLKNIKANLRTPTGRRKVKEAARGAVNRRNPLDDPAAGQRPARLNSQALPPSDR